jgi:hypothetical protein
MGYLKWWPLAAFIALAGCTDASRAIVNQAVETVKRAEDTKARLALQAPCAVTVGAYNRLNDATRQRAVMALCGGRGERPVTAEDLQRFLATPR